MPASGSRSRVQPDEEYHTCNTSRLHRLAAKKTSPPSSGSVERKRAMQITDRSTAQQKCIEATILQERRASTASAYGPGELNPEPAPFEGALEQKRIGRGEGNQRPREAVQHPVSDLSLSLDFLAFPFRSSSTFTCLTQLLGVSDFLVLDVAGSPQPLPQIQGDKIMASDTNNLVLHIRRLVRSPIRLAYHCACDHPEVLGAAIVLLLLHGLCPTLFAFMLSSSPVIVLTALLLGALLSYGEANVPLDGQETLEEHEFLPLKSNIYISDCLIKEVQNVAIKAQLKKRTDIDSCEVYVRERASDEDFTCEAPCEEKNIAYIASDAAVLSGEELIEEERTPNDNLQGTHCEEKNVTFVADHTVLSAEPFNHTKIDVTAECEELTKEINEKAELQELESTCTGSCNDGVPGQYQFGEFMRSCWQPVMRPDPPCYDSESDLTDESSSADASMTDIIPMIEELHSMINSGTGQLSLASRDTLNSSSDDNEDDLGEEEEDVSSGDEEGAEWEQDNQNNWKDVVHLNCVDMEQTSQLENLADLQRAKNILKFELDMRSFDLQAADTTRKMKGASSFHVQVPSISTPRHNPFDLSRDSEETIDLPQFPGSAPSLYRPGRNLFDLPFDRAMHHHSRLQESWTPRSRFRSAQNMKHMSSHGQTHSTCLQHHNGVKLDNGEVWDNHSDHDVAQEGNNGKLFGSLEAHLGEEMKILSAAISDVGVLGEVNHETNEGNKTTSVRDETSSLPQVNISEPHVVEADSMSEVNSLFKSRMQEVLVQSISERSVCQPLEVKPENIPSVSLSSDLWMHVDEAISVQELQFARLAGEALTYAVSDLDCHSGSIRDKSKEASPVVDELSSELPIELDVSTEVSTAGNPQTADTFERNELPVLEASSVEEMNSLFKQLEEEVLLGNGRSKINIPQHRLHELEVDNVDLNSGSRVIYPGTTDDASDCHLTMV
ncbi:uncharacterized protein LOC124696332 [Lolium rigidum]|uniref:uncharacterized protein LOC124696332 n=1 Tax=Lolium rigidum TaxID=89674 RepID=UPI001F5DD328|nr:uncharacterized protein LOC124696332 [Lolium rigidum]